MESPYISSKNLAVLNSRASSPKKNNNILLINPWIYDFAAYDFWIKPIGLLTIGKILNMFGYQVSLIDCLDRFHPLLIKGKINTHLIHKKFGSGKFHREPVEKPEFFADIPRKYCRYGLPLDVFNSAIDQIPRPNVVLVTSAMTYWYPGVFKAIEIVKQKFPKIPVVLGGIYATLFYEHAVNHSGADYVIKGAGEEQALRLVDELTGNQSDWSVFPKTWQEIPEPDYDNYPILPSLSIFTSKGCPYQCSFCASHILSGKFQQKDPAKIIDTIEYYYRKRKIKNVAFFDDALLVNSKSHFLKILEEVIRKNIRVTFHTPNGIHAREIDDELAEIMFRSNFKTIRLSYETANKERQAEMRQKVSDEALSNALSCFEKAGYKRKQIDVYVIMGLPGQPLEEVVQSMILVNSLGAKARLTSFSPIPGTLDWERAVNNCGFPADADPLLTNNSIYPLRNENTTYDQFQQMRYVSKFLNYGLDQGINFFDTSRLAKMVWSKIQCR